MKRILLMALVALGIFSASSQVRIPYQEIPYNVNYHWGLIDVMIARGIVTIQADEDGFTGTLDGTSIPWEGKIICVSDTLKADMTRDSERVNYQSGWYRHPKVSDFRSANYNPDDPATYKNIAGGGTYDASGDSMEAITVTSDMLGMYYYAQALDFPSMQVGESVTIPIDGKYADKVIITYTGTGTYSVDGNTYPTYNCNFEYSYGDRMSGYEVECKIGVTDKIPLFISASLPMGHVEMLYSR